MKICLDLSLSKLFLLFSWLAGYLYLCLYGPSSPKPFEVCMERTALQIHSLPKWSGFLPQVVHKTPKTSYGPFTQVGVHINYFHWGYSVDCIIWAWVYQECQSSPAAVWKARVECSPCEVGINPISFYYLSWVHLKLSRHDHYSHQWEKSEDLKLCSSAVEGGCSFCAYGGKVSWTSCSQFSWYHVWTSVVPRSGERQTARALTRKWWLRIPCTVIGGG